MILGATPMPCPAERADVLRELALGQFIVVGSVMEAWAAAATAAVSSSERSR